LLHVLPDLLGKTLDLLNCQQFLQWWDGDKGGMMNYFSILTDPFGECEPPCAIFDHAQ
jgi:hypothetical protein